MAPALPLSRATARGGLMLARATVIEVGAGVEEEFERLRVFALPPPAALRAAPGGGVHGVE